MRNSAGEYLDFLIIFHYDLWRAESEMLLPHRSPKFCKVPKIYWNIYRDPEWTGVFEAIDFD
jgi:hypothetical protein